MFFRHWRDKYESLVSVKEGKNLASTMLMSHCVGWTQCGSWTRAPQPHCTHYTPPHHCLYVPAVYRSTDKQYVTYDLSVNHVFTRPKTPLPEAPLHAGGNSVL